MHRSVANLVAITKLLVVVRHEEHETLPKPMKVLTFPHAAHILRALSAAESHEPVPAFRYSLAISELPTASL